MAPKSKSPKVVPIFVADDDEDDEECPRCPPVGAPAWMATFADLATLLMAFFVLILSFANFDEVSFKKMTGALKEHFGVKIVEILPNPESTTILEMDFKPTTTPPTTTDAPDPQDNAGPEAEMMQKLVDILSEAMAQGEMSVSNSDGLVSLRLPEGAGVTELAQALAQATEGFKAATQPEQPAPVGEDAGQGTTPDAQAGPGDAGQSATARAAIADARLRVALRELSDQGLVDVQQDKDKVIVTVGAGGAFRSGSADLTADAMEIMARINQSAVGRDAQVTVTGHTDTIPLSGGPFSDNWGLAAARASSVVRELGASGLIDPANLSAVSKGESAPVASNDTEEGRAANRRIEIMFEFGAR
jgi:chemotaxis protein MotB